MFTFGDHRPATVGGLVALQAVFGMTCRAEVVAPLGSHPASQRSGATAPGQLRWPRPLIFGMNPMSGQGLGLGEWFDEYMYRAIAYAGGHCTRICASWHDVEKERGTYKWADLDQTVEWLDQIGLEPFCLVVNTPPWALAPGKLPHQWPPEPRYWPDFRRFCRAVANRYKGRIRYYEFWNEQNGTCWRDVSLEQKARDYAPFLKAAYAELKAGDPDCLVSIGGLDGSGWKGYWRSVEQLYKLGAGDSFDAVAIHPYNWFGPIDIYSLRKVRKVLLAHDDGHKKFWITEFGWDNRFPIEARARWLKESLDILARHDFIEQASYHTIIDFSDAGFGLCRPIMTPKASFHVFNQYAHGKLSKQLRRAVTYESMPNTALPIINADFESAERGWTRFGDTEGVASDNGRKPVKEPGHMFGARHQSRAMRGGCYQRVRAPRGQCVRAAALFLTNDPQGRNKRARCRIGLDATGGADLTSPSVRWSEWKNTAHAWERFEVGQIEPIVAAGEFVTVFLEHDQVGQTVGQITYFDEVELWSYLPEAIEVPTTSPAPDDLLEALLPLPPPFRFETELPADAQFACEFSNAAAMKDWRASRGDWSIKDGLLICSGEDRYCEIELQRPLPEGDWIIEADVRSPRAVYLGLWVQHGRQDRAMLLATNWSMRDNVAFLVMDPNRRAHPYAEKALGDARGAQMLTYPIQPRATYRISVTKHGDRLTTAIDDHQVATMADTPAPSRRMGLYSLRPGYGGFSRVVVRRLGSAGRTPPQG